MRKLILSALCLIGLGATTNAQDYLMDNPNNAAYFGIRASLDITSLQTPPGDPFYNRAGFSIGAVYNIPIWKNLFFEPGLSLFYNTAGIRGIDYIGFKIPSAIINNWGFRIPFNFGYHFDITDDIRIIPYTGPMINLNLSTSIKGVDNNSGQGYNTFDFGWNFGVGVTYKKYYAAIGGTVGMTHYGKGSTYNYVRRNIFDITLGYNF